MGWTTRREGSDGLSRGLAGSQAGLAAKLDAQMFCNHGMTHWGTVKESERERESVVLSVEEDALQ